MRKLKTVLVFVLVMTLLWGIVPAMAAGTTEDIDTALRQLQYDGVLYDDEVTANKLTAMLHKRLEDKRVKEWLQR